MPLRAILLAGLVGVLCLIALVRPKSGLLAYIWFAVMRPDVLAFVENLYPFSLALAIATLVGSLASITRYPKLLATPIARWLLLLLGPITLSCFFAVNYSLSIDLYIEFVKMIGVLLLIPILIENERDLESMLLVVGMSLGFLGLRAGAFSLVYGGVVLVGGYGGLADNNLMALGFVMGIPLCWFARRFTESYRLKLLLLAMVAGSAAAVIMTNSRGGTLALGTVLLFLTFESKHRLGTAVVLVGVTAGAIYMIKDQYFNRMATLENVNGEASAASRITHAKTAVAMWQDYPLLGVGFGGLNYAVLATKYSDGELEGHVAHNSYLQMLVDSGVFAFLIYVGLLLGTVIWLMRMGTNYRTDYARRAAMRLGIGISLIGFLVGGTFYSCQRLDTPYILLLAAACLYSTEHNRVNTEVRDIEDAFGTLEGLVVVKPADLIEICAPGGPPLNRKP